jgi:hypothetical protein
VTHTVALSKRKEQKPKKNVVNRNQKNEKERERNGDRGKRVP